MTQPPPPPSSDPYDGGAYQPSPYQPPYQSPYQPPYPQPQTGGGGGGGGKVALIIVLVVVGVVVLVCGGAVALGFYIAKGVGDGLDEFDSDRRGGPSNPLTVEVGEAFTIDGMDYEEGWSIGKDEFGDTTVVGLSVENDREDRDSDSVSIDFTFLKGNEELSEISCTSDGTIQHGNSETLECYSTSEAPGAYDTIEVSAAY